MNYRNKNIQKIIFSEFQQTFNIYSLHHYCHQIYIKNKKIVPPSFKNLFSTLHLSNNRVILQQKEEFFIKEWKNIIQNKVKINCAIRWQELITLIELLNQKVNKIELCFSFLYQVNKKSWNSLKKNMISKISDFLEKISRIIKKTLVKYSSDQKIREIFNLLNRTKIEMAQSQKAIFPLKADYNINKEQSQTKDGTQKKRQSAKTINNLRESQQFLKIFSSKQKRNDSFMSYQISTAKMFMKEKPLNAQLMTSQELDVLRKSLHQQYSVTRIPRPSGFGVKYYQTEGNQDSEFLSPNQLKRMKALDDLEELQQSKYSQGSRNIQQNFENTKSKKKIARHHKSSCEDKNKISKMIQGKMAKYKFNSIRKIQQNNQANKRNNTQFERSTTKENSIKKSLDTYSNLLKKDKDRNSIMTKFSNGNNTNSSKLFKRKGKHQLTQVFYTKQFKEPQKVNNKDEDDESQSDYSQQKQEEIPFDKLFQHKQQEIYLQDDQDIFQAQDFGPGRKKTNKKGFNKRFGKSMKKIVPAHSIEDISSKKSIHLLERHSVLQPKRKFNRASLFRSSGLTQDSKRKEIKSGFPNKHHVKKMMSTKFTEQIENLDCVELQKNVPASKKSNRAIANDANGYKIDENAVVNTLKMNNIFISIHQQDKMDRQNKYSDYYDEILRRKYEHSVNYQELQLSSCQDKFFKLDSFITHTPKMKTFCNKENKYFDFMKKHIKISQTITLGQSGVDIQNM